MNKLFKPDIHVLYGIGNRNIVLVFRQVFNSPKFCIFKFNNDTVQNFLTLIYRIYYHYLLCLF